MKPNENQPTPPLNPKHSRDWKSHLCNPAIPVTNAPAPSPVEGEQPFKIDFPGGVYGAKPRLTLYDANGNIASCREATLEEYLAWLAVTKTASTGALELINEKRRLEVRSLSAQLSEAKERDAISTLLAGDIKGTWHVKNQFGFWSTILDERANIVGHAVWKADRDKIVSAHNHALANEHNSLRTELASALAALRKWQAWTHITPIDEYPRDCREATDAALKPVLSEQKKTYEGDALP